MAKTLQFSGHETFAIRHGWLKKVVDAIETKAEHSSSTVFNSEESIARFGVGRNMVNSMGHWALSCDVISADKQSVTDFGHFLLSNDGGSDPYLEYDASLWLLHWKLTSRMTHSTTWHFAFHRFAGTTFDRQRLATAISDFCREQNFKPKAQKTIEQDVNCFINTYTVKRGKRGEIGEDSLECPLAELGLIYETAEKGVYEFQIGPKHTLPDSVIHYALNDYFAAQEGTTTMSLEQLTFDPSSPGRAFKLDEGSLSELLVGISETSNGGFEWIGTAGLRQVQLVKPCNQPLDLLAPYYKKMIPGGSRAA